MALQINKLTRENVTTTITNAQVSVDDVFIDGHSLQDTLKKSHRALFSNGRFKHFFMLYLGEKLKDIYHSKEEFLQSPIPEDGATVIAPLYGCSDGCCVYLFVKVKRDNKHFYWEQIGRNTAFIRPSKKQEDDIEWLPSFQPFIFDYNTYNSYFKKVNHD